MKSGTGGGVDTGGTAQRVSRLCQRRGGGGGARAVARHAEGAGHGELLGTKSVYGMAS